MEENLNEIILSERKALRYDAPDDELVERIDFRIKEAKKVKDKIDNKAKTNRKYWNGEQLDINKIPEPRAKIVDNRVFMSLETIIPILTGNVPEPEIQGEIDNELYQTISDRLKIAYEIEHAMPSKLREYL